MEAWDRRLTDDRGVSQVIAIVLLVGIAVILVGVTAIYFTSFAEENREPPPNVSPDTEFNNTYAAKGQYLNITHQGGERLDTDRVYFRVQDARVYSGGSVTGEASYEGNVLKEQAGDEFAVTETVSLNRTAFVDSSGNPLTGSDYLDLTEATVLLVWKNDEGTRTQIIYRCDVGYPACRGGD